MKFRFRLIVLCIAVLCVANACNNEQVETEQEQGHGRGQESGQTDLSFDFGMSGELNIYTNAKNFTPEEVAKLYIEPLRSKFPQVKVNFLPRDGNNTFQSYILAGTRIDLVSDSLAAITTGYLGNGLGYNIADIMKQYGLDTDRFEPTSVQAMRDLADGGLYGFPDINQKQVVYYNKRLFNRFGVPAPRDNMTWDEFAELSKRMTRLDDGVLYYGYGTNVNHPLLTNPYSIPFVDPATQRSTFNDPRWGQLLRAMFVEPVNVAEYRDFLQPNKGLPSRLVFFRDQLIAMQLGFSDQVLLSSAEELEQLDWDMVSVPVLAGHSFGFQDYPGYLVVSDSAQNKALAVQVANYLTSEEVLLERARGMGYVSSLDGDKQSAALAQSAAFRGKNTKAIFYHPPAAVAPLPSFPIASVQSAIVNATKDAYIGNTDLNTALRTAEEEANKAIETELAK